MQDAPLPSRPSAPRYVGACALLRAMPPAFLLLAFVTLASSPVYAAAPALMLTGCAICACQLLPWRFAVVDEGLALWFPLGRRRFLPRDAVTVRITLASAVAHPLTYRRARYPLTDGLLQKRLPVLRAVLVEHGFEVN